MPISVKYTAIF